MTIIKIAFTGGGKGSDPLLPVFSGGYPFAMKKNAVFCLAAVLCAGCRAHMMETHGDTVSLFSPQKDKQGRGGVIRYLNTGFDAWRRSRRQDADSQMQHFCGGTYKVV